MGTLILLLAMVGFMAGVILGELRDQADVRQAARDEVELAEIDAYFASIRPVFAAASGTGEKAA